MRSQLLRVALVSQVLLLAFAGDGFTQSRFDRWDRNGDGRLTRDELPPPARRNFDRADRDGDGAIGPEEDAAFVRNRTGQGKGGKGKGKGKVGEDPAIRILEDLPYAGTDNERQTLHLYLPARRNPDAAPLPLIVFIHGGGWRRGEKRSGFARVRDFVASGDFAAASIGYRLSGEAVWPAQIHDCKAAIRWLRTHAADHGIDPDRIGVWGTSAGGHLAAMLGVAGPGEREGSLGDHLDTSSRVQCVVDFFGPSELLAMNDQGSAMDHDAPGSPESLLIGGPIRENREMARDASPIHRVSEGDAPFLIVHGTEDRLVPHAQSVELADALEKAGVPVVLLTVEGGGHGQGFGPAAGHAVRSFLDHHLRGVGPALRNRTVAAGE